MEENQMELALAPAKLYYNSTLKIPMKFAIAVDLCATGLRTRCVERFKLFLEQCPEDPISEMIRAQINNIRINILCCIN